MTRVGTGMTETAEMIEVQTAMVQTAMAETATAASGLDPKH